MSHLGEPPHRASLTNLYPSENSGELETNSQELASGQVKRRFVIGGGSVYISDEDTRMAQLRKFAIAILLSPSFDTVMGIVISINSVTIGFELSFRLEDKDTQIIEDLEHVFLIIYVIELGLRFIALRLVALRDKSVIFDCVLVFSGMLITWCMGPLGLTDAESGVVDPGMLVVLRTLRLLRLARAVRLLVKFRELWMLVRSLMNSAGTMFYVMILMVIILYILACVGCEVVSMHDYARGTHDSDPIPEFELIVLENFESIGLTMMTLVQFVCLDSISSIFKPLCKIDPYLTWYFMGSVLLLGIVLMNLITAVVVNSAMEQAVQDKELLAAQEIEKKERLVRELRKMFVRLDGDNSGQISRDEICGISEADKKMLYDVLSIADPTELFDAIDADENGCLDIEEFCDAIWQVTISKVPIEIKRMAKQFKVIRENLRDVLATQAQMRQVITDFKQMVNKATVAGSPAAVVDQTQGKSAGEPAGKVAQWCPPPAASSAGAHASADWLDDLALRLRISLQEGLRETMAQAVSTAVAARTSAAWPPPDVGARTSAAWPAPDLAEEPRPSPQVSPRTSSCGGDRLAAHTVERGPIDASEIALVQRFPDEVAQEDPFSDCGPLPRETHASRDRPMPSAGGAGNETGEGLDGSRNFPISC